MLIYRTVRTNALTQKFGENKACVRTGIDGRVLRPFQVRGKRGDTCAQGWTDFYKAIGMDGHSGDDWATWYKEPLFFNVLAECEWTARTSMDLDGGIGLDVYSNIRIAIDELPKEAGSQTKKEWADNDGFMYVKIRYWHAQNNLVADGQPVTVGQRIQFCDSSGASSGNHVHTALKFVDAQKNTLDKNNGYYGAVDSSRWQVDMFILDLGMKGTPTLTAVEMLKSMARTILSSDWKLSGILNSIAQIVEAFGGIFKTKRSESKLTFKQ